MRYYGTITGRIRNFGDYKFYLPGGEKEIREKYEFEIEDVHDEDGNIYGTKFVRVNGVTSLVMESYIFPGNLISFDCSGFEDNIILKIRNCCPSITGVGLINPADPFTWEHYFNLEEFNDFFKESNIGLNCAHCKYNNNKKLCSKYKV